MTRKELDIQLRGDVRSILSAFPQERGVPVKWITDHINKHFPYPATEELVMVALLWNQSARGWCDFRVNQITEKDEWFLTTKGRKQEGVK